MLQLFIFWMLYATICGLLVDHIVNIGRKFDVKWYVAMVVGLLSCNWLMQNPTIRRQLNSRLDEMDGYDVIADWLISVVTYEMFFGGVLFLTTVTGIIQALNELPKGFWVLAFA